MASIADSLYNLQLLKEFASEYLNKSFYLSTEDMLYSPLVLKVHTHAHTHDARTHTRTHNGSMSTRSPASVCSVVLCGYDDTSLSLSLPLQHNVMVFIAELFWWFETVKPEFVQPKHLQEFKDGGQQLPSPDSSLP